VGMQSNEMDQLLSDMVAQNVTVIEADSALSNYLTDSEFDQELALMTTFASAVHAKGLRVVWYYPALEVLTENGVNLSSTMYKDHPDWVQIGIDGTDNVFYGGEGSVFWVEPGMESAWMSPNSGYRAYYLDRVGKIAATGIDGLWLDVPLLNDLGTQWADFNPASTAQFTSETGLQAPTTVDWSNETFRRWVAWRHKEISDFIGDINVAVKTVDPTFTVIVETVTMDYNAATNLGLDGADLKALDGVTHVWEIDALSDDNAMRNALPNDWVSLIAMNKYSRAASGSKPAWVFTYGKNSDDAGLVMAEALAAGNNPFEAKIPDMLTSVGANYRTRMFGWAEANSSYLFGTETGARVGLFYSSASRDFVDQAQGIGLYATTTSNDPLWWSTDAIDSTYQRQYLAEYRGMVKLLVNEHIPFDIVVYPDSQELAKYDTVILPDVEAMSAQAASLLRQYVYNGGRIVVTGPNPSGLDEYGTARTNYGLADVLGFNKGATPPTTKVNPFGAGEARYFSGLLGKDYFVSDDSAAQSALATAVRETSANVLSTNADKRVHFELTKTANEIILQSVNFIGVDGSFSVVQTSFSVNLTLPPNTQATSVSLTSPDNATPALEPVTFTQGGGVVTFDLTVDEYSMVVVSVNSIPGPTNTPPVANNDSVTTDQDVPVTLAASTLLANDSDADGDTLSILSIDTTSSNGGSITDNGDATFTYTPAAGFSGTDSFTYSISDANGGTDTATVTVTVNSGTTPPTTTTYFPGGVTVLTGSYDWGTLASFTANDADTYDINSAAAGGGQVVDWYASATITGSPAAVTQLTMTYAGQYSIINVEQQVSLYNFETSTWELFDTRSVGNVSDVTVMVDVSANAKRFVASNGEIRVRIRGFHTTNSFFVWANELSWDIVQGSGNPPPPVNTPPVAVNDSLTTDQDVSVTFAGTMLLSNDSDADGDTLSISAIDSTSANGAAVIDNGGGNYTYSPLAGFSGTDTFGYTVTDGNGGFSSATVTMMVVGTTNTPPVANNDSVTTDQDVPVTLMASTLLANDSDADGDALSILSIDTTSSNGGSITDNGDATFTYTPAAGFSGTDSFTYSITDANGGTDNATVTVTVNSGMTPPTTTTYFPGGVTVLTGSYDWGTLASFTASDADTYDINSAASGGGQVVDWYASATISGSPAAVTQLTMTYAGQYSEINVEQQVSLYNFETSTWELFDARSVGNVSDVTVAVNVTTNAKRFVASNGEIRVRIRGFHATNSFFVWANDLSWVVVQGG